MAIHSHTFTHTMRGLSTMDNSYHTYTVCVRVWVCVCLPPCHTIPLFYPLNAPDPTFPLLVFLILLFIPVFQIQRWSLPPPAAVALKFQRELLISYSVNPVVSWWNLTPKKGIIIYSRDLRWFEEKKVFPQEALSQWGPTVFTKESPDPEHIYFLWHLVHLSKCLVDLNDSRMLMLWS